MFLLLCSSAASIGEDDAEMGHQTRQGLCRQDQGLKRLSIIDGLGKGNMGRIPGESALSAHGYLGAVTPEHMVIQVL